MNEEAKLYWDIIVAVEALKDAFDEECSENNPYFAELREIYETKAGAIETLADTEDFIDEYLRDEYLDLVKKILAKHVWCKYFDGFLNSTFHGTEKILSDENSSLKEKIKSLQEETQSLKEENRKLSSRLITVKKVVGYDQNDLEMCD